MKVYDIVKQILLEDVKARNSDKHLMWKVWQFQGIGFTYKDWMEYASHPKSIIESRRNLQRNQEKKIKEGQEILESEMLIANKEVKDFRKKIDKQKGTHIFRDRVPFTKHMYFNDGIAYKCSCQIGKDHS